MIYRVFATFVLLFITTSSAMAGLLSGNPIIQGAADPFAAVFGNRLYAYPTTGNGKFFAYSSSDLGNWRNDGQLLNLANVSWANGSTNAWAPCMVQRNGTYYFYYSVGGSTSRIGVATGSSPTGPFVDSGKPLLTDTTGGQAANTFEAIDPEVFQDPVSGKTYLYAGGSRGSKLRIFELDSTLTNISQEISVATPTNFTEGAFVHYKNNRYYLSYSHGNWADDSYSVDYAVSTTPVGPWTYSGQILGSNSEDKGPGHHSFFELNGTSYIMYHRWEDVTGSGPYNVNGRTRNTAIDTFTYNTNGAINPITMTNSGVPLTTVPEPAAFCLAAGMLMLGGRFRPVRRARAISLIRAFSAGS